MYGALSCERMRDIESGGRHLLVVVERSNVLVQCGSGSMVGMRSMRTRGTYQLPASLSHVPPAHRQHEHHVPYMSVKKPAGQSGICTPPCACPPPPAPPPPPPPRREPKEILRGACALRQYLYFLYQ
jgi:hypothetical protein